MRFHPRPVRANAASMATLAFQNPAAATEPQQLPRNIEAEAALLGAMMIDNRLADDLVDRLDPEHFFEPVHGRIFSAIKIARHRHAGDAGHPAPDVRGGRGDEGAGRAVLSGAADGLRRGPDRRAAVRDADL